VPVRTPAELTAIQLLRRLGAPHLREGSSDVEIRSAWRQLLRECHPDAHPHAREADRIVLTARLRAVIRARDILDAPTSARQEAA
jgi:curved DNA-binding protein CbpA